MAPTPVAPARTVMPTPLAVRPVPSTPIGTRTVPPAVVTANAGDFVNLGDLLREEGLPRSTRMVVEERAPSGDEEADFVAMLSKFKQGVAENVDDEDYDSHYDLGVAYKEMGLVDEAIAAFQRALRGTTRRARTYEALGQCFLERRQFAVAAAVLQRATQEPGLDDQQLVGVLYLLGRAAESTNQRSEALRYYERVLAVDITFSDVADRIGAVEQVVR
jgi:tetratricopeptide (TPR) repeat protein